jgi:hypothetical protein
MCKAFAAVMPASSRVLAALAHSQRDVTRCMSFIPAVHYRVTMTSIGFTG